MDEVIRFNWNEANVEHIARHNVAPEEVEQVFASNPLDLGYEEIEGEERYTSIGHTREYRVLLIVWTVRHEAIRAITAREVSRKVRERYLRKRGI